MSALRALALHAANAAWRLALLAMETCVAVAAAHACWRIATAMPHRPAAAFEAVVEILAMLGTAGTFAGLTALTAASLLRDAASIERSRRP